MRKNILPRIAIAACCILITACGKEAIEENNTEPRTIRFTANMPVSTPDTRVNYDFTGFDADDTGMTGIPTTWKEGDEVTVYRFGQGTSHFTLESGENSASGTFTGTLPTGDIALSVQYPKDSGSNINFRTGQQQTTNASTAHLDAFNYMRGVMTGNEDDGYKANFVPWTALFKFILTLPSGYSTEETFSSLKFEGSYSNLWRVSVRLGSASGGNDLTLGLNNIKPDASGVLTTYMMVVPSDRSIFIPANQTLTLILTGSEKIYTFVLTVPTGGITYIAGKAYVGKVGADDWTTVAPVTP